MESLKQKTFDYIKTDFANILDINQILDIQKNFLLRNKKTKQISNNGFLINKVSKKDLFFAIKNSKKYSFLLVAKNKNDHIVGYFLAYDFNFLIKKNPDLFINTLSNIRKFKNKKILYGKHIVSDGTIKGIGTSLNNVMFSIAKEYGYNFYLGEICEAPIKNTISLDFHIKKFLMKKIKEYKDSNNFTWGIYLKNL
jgi:hypothetical protein